jgi:hypothetical protein
VLFAQGLDECVQDGRRHQPLAHHGQDVALEARAVQRGGVGAVTVAGAQAAQVALSEGGEGVAAGAAEDLAAEQVARPAAVPEAWLLAVGVGGIAGGAVCLEALRDAGPQFVGYDPKVLRLGLDVVLGRVVTAHQRTGDRVLEVVAAVPDQPAVVDRVAQDAVLPPDAAADGVLEPGASIGSGNALGIEQAGDPHRADTFRVEREDPADHGGLVLLDAAKAPLQVAVVAKAALDPVAIGGIASGASLADAPLQAAMGLGGEVLEVEAGHGAAQADMHVGDHALGEGDDLGVVEDDPFVDVGDVLEVAREPVQALGEDDINAAALHLGEEGINALAVPQGAG